jgi:hypothetical protein
MSTMDLFLLALIKWLGGTAFAVWLFVRFVKTVVRELLDLRDWWSGELRARNSRAVRR